MTDALSADVWLAGRILHLRSVPGLAEMPAHDLEQMLRFANEMAGFFGSPVYLCGSALAKPDPRDIDIRINLVDADFAVYYAGPIETSIAVDQWVQEGLTGAWGELRHRWSRDCTKRTKRAWRLTNQNVDFQVYPASWARTQYAGRPRKRIDEPAPAAARRPPRWS